MISSREGIAVIDDGITMVITSGGTSKTSASQLKFPTSSLIRLSVFLFPIFVLCEIVFTVRRTYLSSPYSESSSSTASSSLMTYDTLLRDSKTTTTTTTTPMHENPLLCPGFFASGSSGNDAEDDVLNNVVDTQQQRQNQRDYSTMSLRAIVTGLEHSGTTLTGSLLYNAPCVIGAFETGFLLADNPTEIENVKPWFGWNNASNNILDINYRLHPQDVAIMKKATNHMEMYNILRHRSYLFNTINDDPSCSKPTQMIDKTPLYIYPAHFEKIISKTRIDNVPIIVTKKNYTKLKESWDRRDSNPPKPYKTFRQFYDATFNNVCLMMSKYPTRPILIINEEELMSTPAIVMERVFTFLGLSWKDEYLQMTGLLGKFNNDTRTSKQIEQYIFKSGKHSFDWNDTKKK